MQIKNLSLRIPFLLKAHALIKVHFILALVLPVLECQKSSIRPRPIRNGLNFNNPSVSFLRPLSRFPPSSGQSKSTMQNTLNIPRQFSSEFPAQSNQIASTGSIAIFPPSNGEVTVTDENIRMPGQFISTFISQSNEMASASEKFLNIPGMRKFRVLLVLLSGLRNTGLKETIAFEILERLLRTTLKDLLIPFKMGILSAFM